MVNNSFSERKPWIIVDINEWVVWSYFMRRKNGMLAREPRKIGAGTMGC